MSSFGLLSVKLHSLSPAPCTSAPAPWRPPSSIPHPPPIVRVFFNGVMKRTSTLEPNFTELGPGRSEISRRVSNPSNPALLPSPAPRKIVAREDAKSLCVQLCGFFPLWVSMCVFRIKGRGNESLHSAHFCTFLPVCVRGERIIWYSNNIRITNIRIRIRPQIETRILFIFVFVQKFGSEYYSYSYSSKNLGPNIIRIRIQLF